VGREIEPGVILAPGASAFCFVAGRRIYVSSAAWDALAEEERAAMLAHERAHVVNGDLPRRALLGLAGILGAPWFAARLLGQWRGATEKVCDRAAASSMGTSVAVAQALVTLSRLAGARATPTAAAAFVHRGVDVVERVEAVLGDGPDGRGAARRIARAAAVLFATVGIMATVLADPLHHAIETLLGAF
jgi:beta-lactamase regulating signal transducer with metallopeptidase domain